MAPVALLIALLAPPPAGTEPSAVLRPAGQDGRPDVARYFGRDNGLLVKNVLRPHAGGERSVQEEIFSDFREVEGLKRPTRVRILINGVPHAEGAIRSTVFLR